MTMDSEPGMPSRVSPEISFMSGERKIIMTWNNTLLRFFDEGDGMFDHVAHKPNDEEYFAFQPSDELKERLLSEGFSRRHDAVVDEATIQWYVQVMANDLLLDQTDPTTD